MATIHVLPFHAAQSQEDPLEYTLLKADTTFQLIPSLLCITRAPLFTTPPPANHIWPFHTTKFTNDPAGNRVVADAEESQLSPSYE
jgi:hypothetical protein